MRTLLWCATVWLFPLAVLGQVSDAGSAKLEPGTLVEAGPHEQVWTSGDPLSDRRVVEIGTGMNYWDGQRWAPSDPSFEITEDAFIANRLQYKVRLPENLNVSKAVTVVTPDGIILHSTPVGIGLYDAASGQSVIIGSITNCSGVLVGDRMVVYENAFAGVCADVIYTIDRGTFSQDVVITGRLDPAAYGFPPKTTRIQIFTEFYDSPPQPDRLLRPIYVEENQAVRNRMVSPDLVDEVLGFGEFVLWTGRAATLANITTDGNSAAVAKQFATASGRTFLIESVEYVAIQADLDALPECQIKTASIRKARDAKGDGYAALPPSPTGETRVASTTAAKQIAKATTRKGVVIDYTATIGGNINTPKVFQGDTTYFLSSAVFCNSLATIEAGAVFKYPTNANVYLKLNSTVICRASSYRPAIFTAADDSTVGDALSTNIWSGYTGNVGTNYYGNPALWVANGSSTILSNVFVRYAHEAMRFEAAGSVGTVSHAQLINCIRGIVLNSGGGSSGSGGSSFVTINNTLFRNVQRALNVNNESSSGTFYNCTIAGSTNLITSTVSSASATFYNSLFVNVTNLTSGSASVSGKHNGFHKSPVFGTLQYTNASYPFQSLGAGNHYLPTNSPFLNVGATTNGLSVSTLNELRKKTVFAPSVLTDTYTTPAILGPLVQRDTDALDLGYHYDPIDWAINTVTVTNTTLTLSNGVALATFGNNGIWLQDGSQLISEGWPTNHNHLTRFFNVQEQPTNWGGGMLSGMVTINPYNTGVSPPSAQIRFTDFDGIAASGYHLFTYPTNWTMSSLLLWDSSVNSGSLYLAGPTNSAFGITNNLFERVASSFRDSLQLSLYNNLFRFGTNTTVRTGSSTWTFADNAFDNSRIIDTGSAVSASYNAYINMGTNRFYPTNANDKVLTSFTYRTGPLGAFYHFSSNLINAGSRNATNAGLYHYTVTTNFVNGTHVKETNSIVDIGFHYVALATNNVPVDTDGDGLPDYLEDRNGNGTFNSGENSWLDPAPSVSITNPVNSQVFVTSPTNITIQATASDNGSVTNVAFYNGTTLLGNDTTSPYSLTWNNVAAGTYTLTAKASDNLGGWKFSTPVTIIVNAMPSVSLTNPITGSHFSPSPTNILLQATASDADGSITNVAFYNGANLLGNVTASPYNLTWSNVIGGSYALTARATDNRGAGATSSVVNITVNGGLYFGTNNAYVTFSNNPSLGLKFFTLETWFRRTGAGTTTTTGSGGITAVPLVTKGRSNGSDGSNADMNYFLGIDTSGVIAADFEDFTSGANHPVLGITTISNGVWYHAAITYNGTNWQLYLNGELEKDEGEGGSSSANGLFPRYDSTQHAALGTAIAGGSPAGYFAGVMDEVRVWNYARTRQQIRDNMNREIPNECGLVARWALNEGVGTSVTNATGTSITGTITGSGYGWTNSSPLKAGGAVLLVSDNTGAGSADAAIKSRLESLGFNVTVKTGSAATSGDATKKTLVVISSSVTASQVNTKFRTSPVPVITWRHDLFDDMGLVVSNASYYGTTSSQTSLDIVSPTHEMAAGLVGTVNVVSNNATFAWGQPTNSAVVVGRVAGNSTNATVFGYEKGYGMVGLVAPARRAGLFLHESAITNLNANGWAMFDAAITWAVTPPCPPLLDLVFVIDHSNSMSVSGGGTNLTTAKNHAKYFTTNMNLALDQAGVVSFDANAIIEINLSHDTNAILDAIDGIGTGSGSDLHDGINSAQGVLNGGNHVIAAAQVMILFTDGKVDGGTNRSVYAASQAKLSGSRIISIGIGASPNTETLKLIATSCSDYFTNPNATQLGEILASITNVLCRVATNQPPSVTLNSPTNNQLFVYSPTNVFLQATASDPDVGGSITSVTFYNGTTQLGAGNFNSLNNRYEFVWLGVTNGSYALHARATDNLQATTASATANISVNAMPLVSITTPTNNATFKEVTNITINVTATDPDGTISKVEFFHGFTEIGEDTSSPYSMVWSNLTAGVYPITAKATDNLGAISETAITLFRVNSTNPFPTVAITFPTNGAVFRAGVDITITATASDAPPGSVTNVEFFVNGQLLGNDPTSPYSIKECCWKAGSYVLTARATDNLGLKTVSVPVNIVVVEELPTAADGFWDPEFGNPGPGAFPTIWALASGPGKMLYAGGNFTTMEGVNAQSIARWDGTNWFAMSNGLAATVFSILAENALVYAGGSFSTDGNSNPMPFIAKWNGTTWNAVGTNDLNNTVRAIALVGGDLYVGGDFTAADQDDSVQRIARLDAANNRWVSVGNEITNGTVYAITSISNRLYVGGSFTDAGGNTNADYIACLVNNTWTNLGAGVSGTNSTGGIVRALAACGNDLFVGGDFLTAGGVTEANGIAIWNGQWRSVAGGIKEGTFDDESVTDTGVFTISLRENHAFVGGEFTKALNGTNVLKANYIARATWSEANQTWTWTDLDQGVSGYGAYDHIFASTIVEGNTSNAYDLFVGGCFLNVGKRETPNNNIGRWSVGRPYPPTAPTVVITNPTDNTIFTNPPSITIQATTTPGDTNTPLIVSVEFFSDGTSLGAPDFDSPYSFDWTSGISFGPHLLTAVVVTEGNGPKGVSEPVVIEIVDSNSVVRAVGDLYTILENSPATTFFVLTNDTPSTARISKAEQVQTVAGDVQVGHDGTYIVYTPFANTYGTDIFIYTITNAAGVSSTASVTVKLRSPPQLFITDPNDGERTTAPAIDYPIQGTTFDWDGTVTNVQLYVNGAPYAGQPISSGSFNFTWNQGTPGFYTFSALGTDSHGITNASAPVTLTLFNSVPSPNQPVAGISNLVTTITNSYGVESFIYPVIREGLFDLTGSAYDADAGDLVVYQVLLFRPDLPGEPFANVTPGTLNLQGFRTNSVVNGSLGTLDLTAVPNGTYDLVLNVRGGTDEARATVRVSLNTELKVGRFTFSEQDLVIPVNGLPLALVRTYDSFNPIEGDFGFNWTYALSDMDVVIDEDRVTATATETFEDIGDASLDFSLRIGGGRDVTLTLPDGTRTTFRFALVNSAAPGLNCPGCVDAVWIPAPGVLAKLTTPNPATYEDGAGDNTLIPLFALGYVWKSGGQFTPLEAFDFPKLILTTPDGTKFEITRDLPGETLPTYIYQDFDLYFGELPQTYYIQPHPGKPKLTKIVQRSGDVIRISDTGVAHYAPGATEPTRSLFMQRDDAGRITAMFDPNSGVTNEQSALTAKPVVKYIYNRDTGNLIQVHRLQDRAAGTYTTNKYHYDHPNPKFRHYITSIEDPRGIRVARNLYDDSGRLIGVIDSRGQTNRFEHDIAGRREIHYDRSGTNATTFQYDPRGNVTAIVNALNHTNRFLYDDSGYLTNSVDALGNTTVYTNDTDGNVLSVTVPYPAGADPADYTTHFTYNDFGEQTSVRLPTGGVITNEFDPFTGLLLAVKDGDDNVVSATVYNGLGLPLTESDAFGSLNYGYDEMGNLTKMTNSLGHAVSSLYDPNGNLTNLVDGSSTTTVQYDAMNRETFADYGNDIEVSYGFEGEGDWTTVEGPTLGSMERKIDDQGRLAGWETANGSTPGFAYDVNGRLEYETNSIGVVTRTVYNAAGWVTGSTNLATGAWAAYGHDAAGQRIAVTNALGFATRYGYHPSGSLKAMTNAFGTNFWLYSDAAGACADCGNSVSVTDPFGRVTESIGSPYGLPVSTVWRSGSLVSSNFIEYLDGLTTPEQEAEEYPVAITDEGARTRRYDYDDQGRLYRATDLSGSTWWTNQFDPTNGALLAVISPTAETNSYVYDALNNVKAIRFSDNNWLTNYYDSTNRLSGVRLPSGALLTNAYDFAGRLTNRQAKVSGVVTETASFTFNGNDAVTVMSDNTGGTTNLYDDAGRLWGIDYPSGASVRYQLDVLGRIAAITNKALVGGFAYVTRYQYDPVGNVTNVVDPFDGETSYEYDRVGRRTKRTLPIGVVTEWQYDWRDRVTNIVHKTSGGSTLASFTYWRNPGGEPWKIMREDGTYVELKYDPAWRLTNEVYYASGGGSQTTNSYAYDASGSRIKLVQGGLTLTNSVSGGYQITAVKNAANGNTTNSYAYDAGGRVTSINRDGTTLNLGYNTADQVQAVTNGVSWTTYGHDASGRRTFATNNTSVRKFLVAPTAEADLESPQLIANASGTVQQCYVYLGNEPIARYSTGGNPMYYLEDAMGSVAALVDDNENVAARFNYDGFGNVRSQSGSTNAPAGTGGDFRFHGAWLEADSGLYHMRAREYDARMGRFMSRDPVGGDFKAAETLNPYQYGLNNAIIASDRSGQFSLIEINITGAIQTGIAGFKAAATHYAKQRIKRGIAEAVSDVIGNQILNLLGGNIGTHLQAFVHGLSGLTDGLEVGNLFGNKAHQLLCFGLDEVGASSDVKEAIHANVRVAAAWTPTMIYPGMPLTNGRNCTGRNKPNRTGWSVGVPYGVPDFIIGDKPIEDLKGPAFNQAFTVGDFKWSLKSLHDYYAAKTPKNPNQWTAITGYAKKHTYSRTALFIVGHNKKGLLGGAVTSKEKRAILNMMASTLIKEGVIPLVVVMVD